MDTVAVIGLGYVGLPLAMEFGMAAVASTATTIACEPNRSAASRTSSGVRIAAVLMATLSAPASSSAVVG